jgi:hypothetical protein
MFGQPHDELGALAAPEEVVAVQRSKDILRKRGDVLRQAEQVRFGDSHGAQLASPAIDITEKEPVELLQVG